MNDEFSRDEGRALWRQAMAAARPAPVTGPVAALDLAAWLDGRADAALAARIEAALLTDPTLLDMALAASAATDEADSAACERLAVRARALVAPQIRPVRSSGGWLVGFGRWRRQAEWAVVGLSLMVAAAAGLWIGGDVGDTVLSQTANLSLFGDDSGFAGLLSSTEDL